MQSDMDTKCYVQERQIQMNEGHSSVKEILKSIWAHKRQEILHEFPEWSCVKKDYFVPFDK